MICFDFDGVLYDSRATCLSAYQQARAEFSFAQLPDLRSVDDLGLVYAGRLSQSLLRWLDRSESELFWRRHAGLTAKHPDHDGLIDDVIPGLVALAAAGGYTIVSGSHESLVMGVLARSLPPDAMPRMVSCREVPGTKTAKLISLRALYGEVAYVGDTGSDVLQAREAGVRAIAVTYGYSHLNDIRQAHPETILSAPAELARFCQASLEPTREAR